MNEEEEYPSDTSDEDYIPTGISREQYRRAVRGLEIITWLCDKCVNPTADSSVALELSLESDLLRAVSVSKLAHYGEALSEEGASGEEEAPLAAEQDHSTTQLKGKRKRTKNKSELTSRKRQGGISLVDTPVGDDNRSVVEDDYNKQLEKHIEIESQEKKEENEKKKANDLWADFMKDVGEIKPKPKSSSGLGSLSSTAKPASSTKISQSDIKSNGSCTSSSGEKAGKITITKEYDFAGEVVQVTKEVDVNSKEAKVELMKQPDVSKPTAGPSLAALKRPTAGGLGSVLGKIGKKQKISTLEKSQLDWNNFKKKEGIDEELQIHNRGKQSYIERQAFLERTDYRQFEIERNLRLSNSKR